MKKQILITGGDGYIGSKLVLALEEKDCEVEVFDRVKKSILKNKKFKQLCN